MIWWCVSWEGVDRPRPGRCSWATGPQETARQTVVTVIGNMLRGRAQLAVVRTGLQQSALRDNLPLGLWPPLELMLPPLESVLSFVMLVLLLLCCIVPWLLLPCFCCRYFCEEFADLFFMLLPCCCLPEYCL